MKLTKPGMELYISGVLAVMSLAHSGTHEYRFWSFLMERLAGIRLPKYSVKSTDPSKQNDPRRDLAVSAEER
jgi:hypothetical protein